jgi:multiple sugar transport system substrate-binding protein
MSVRRCWIALALSLALGSQACSHKATTSLTFVFRGDWPEVEIMVDTISQFEKEHPGIQVNIMRAVRYPDSLYNQSDPLPDVFFVEQYDFASFLRRGLLLDLSPLLASDPSFSLSTYYPHIVARFSHQGRPYVIPRDVAPHCCVFYNRDLFRAAGLPFPADDWSWPKDFLPVAQKLTQRDAQGRIQCFGFLDDWPAWEEFVLSNGGAMLDELAQPTRILLDSPQSIAALQFRRDLILKYQVMPDPTQVAAWGIYNNRDMFLQGKTAMFLSGVWQTPVFRDNCGFDWDIVLFPRGPSGPRRFATGGSGYGINAKCTQPQAAWELVKYLAGRPGLEVMAHAGLAQPADRKIAESPVFLDAQRPRNRKCLLQAAEQTVFSPDWEHWNEFVGNYLNPGLADIWTGKKDTAQVMHQLVRRANKDFFR